MRVLLIVILVILLAWLANSLGWISFSRTSGPSRDTVGVTVNKDEVKKDMNKADESVKTWGESAREALKDAGRKIKDTAKSTSSDDASPQLLVSRYAVALEPGTKIDVMVTRTGDDLNPTELSMTTTPGSNLVVTGGKFGNGERQTVVSIAAPIGAVDGRVDLSDGPAKESITVEVKSTPASMWEQNVPPPGRESYRF